MVTGNSAITTFFQGRQGNGNAGNIMVNVEKRVSRGSVHRKPISLHISFQPSRENVKFNTQTAQCLLQQAYGNGNVPSTVFHEGNSNIQLRNNGKLYITHKDEPDVSMIIS